MLAQKAEDHDANDVQRFADVHKKLDSVPKEFKKELNGSVERTVKTQINSFLIKLIAGIGLVVIAGAVAWGTLTTSVATNSKTLEDALNDKDLVNINTQFANQAAAIQTISEDVKFIRNTLVK